MKKILAVLVMALALAGFIYAADSFMIENGEDSTAESTSGGWWYVYDDASSQGNSVVWPKPNAFEMSAPGSDGKGFCARMKGTTGNKLGWDFVGMGVAISKDTICPTNKPMDISEYKYLQFKAKGTITGGRLIVVLPYMVNICKDGKYESNKSLTEWADYEAAISPKLKNEWTTIKLELRKDFKQPKWAKTQVDVEKVLKAAGSVSFHFSSADGDSVDLSVDDLQLVK